MASEEKVLVVAFDGMDKELVEEYELNHIIQEEFGSIDNTTDISRRMTPELFASFITGETYNKHGVEGLGKGLSTKDRILDRIFIKPVLRYIRGAHRLRTSLMDRPSGDRRRYIKEDLQCSTIFEEIDAALPLYVPSYNPSIYWMMNLPHGATKYRGEKGFVKESRQETNLRLEYGTADQPAFEDINEEFWDLIMLHLHEPDAFQDTKLGDLEKEYNRLDGIANEILERFDDWTVIFMSDHGRPEQKLGPHDHNENAFYSCNRKIFEDKVPHITDFYNKIIELVDG